MESGKMVLTILYAGQQRRHRYKEQALDTVGEGEGGMIWENSIETYILPNVKQIASGNSIYDTETQSQGTVTTKRDVVGRETGGVFKREETHESWLIHADVWQKAMTILQSNYPLIKDK